METSMRVSAKVSSLERDRSWDVCPRRERGYRRGAYSKGRAPNPLEIVRQILEARLNIPVFQLKREVDDLKKKFESLGGMVVQLQAAVFGKKEVPLDEYDKWLASEDAAKHAGLHVAFVPGSGVIASAPTGEELMEKIAGYPNQNEVSVSIVPSCRVVIR